MPLDGPAGCAYVGGPLRGDEVSAELGHALGSDGLPQLRHEDALLLGGVLTDVGGDAGQRVLELRLTGLAALDDDDELLDLLVLTAQRLRVVLAADGDQRRVEGPAPRRRRAARR